MWTRLVLAGVLALGAWSAWLVGLELVGATGRRPLLGELGAALSSSGEARVTAALEASRPGGAAVLEHLLADLPQDAVIFALHADAGDPDQAGRVEALLLLGQLQLLVFPRDLRPMPGALGGPTPLASPFVPPPAFLQLASEGRLFALDLGYPHPERVEAFLAPLAAAPGAVLWGPRP